MLLLHFKPFKMSTDKEIYKRITVKTLTDMKSKNEKISMLTAYDYTMAQIVDGSGIDVILVGDSASNVMAGHETTLPITLDQMIVEMVANDLEKAKQHALLESCCQKPMRKNNITIENRLTSNLKPYWILITF